MRLSFTAVLCGLASLTSVLASPVAIRQQPPSNKFLVEEFTTQNTRAGQPFQAKLSGLLANTTIPVTYSIYRSNIPSTDGNSNWISITPDGTLTGTPKGRSRKTRVTIIATNPDKSTTSIDVTIPIIGSGSRLVEKLNTLSYNLWHGGTRVNNFHPKQVSFLASSNFDIVVLQEASRDDATRLGTALGWYHFQGGPSAVGVISRYPIVEIYPEHGHGIAVRVRLGAEEDEGDDAAEFNVWGVHLNSAPYGPYDFCFDNMTIPQVMQREEESKRAPQIRETIGLMKDHLSNTDDIPILMFGDFNSPSHLDWTDENKHCGVGAVAWPASSVPTQAGLIDSYRQVNPDPVANPGNTWSPIFLENEGRPEPMDRIDYVYHKGAVKAVQAETLAPGNPVAQPNHGDNYWTSDHTAVRAVFRLDRD